MSKMDFLNDLNEIDEKMIEEAAPKKAGSGNGRFLAWALAAAAVILTVGLGVWLHGVAGEAAAVAAALAATPPAGRPVRSAKSSRSGPANCTVCVYRP